MPTPGPARRVRLLVADPDQLAVTRGVSWPRQ
jgi:hypothetical protein